MTLTLPPTLYPEEDMATQDTRQPDHRVVRMQCLACYNGTWVRRENATSVPIIMCCGRMMAMIETRPQ